MAFGRKHRKVAHISEQIFLIQKQHFDITSKLLIVQKTYLLIYKYHMSWENIQLVPFFPVTYHIEI